MTGILLFTCLFLALDFVVSEDGFVDRVPDVPFYRDLPEDFYFALLIILLFVNGPLFMLDLQLMFLHAFLIYQNQTTYEYIVQKLDRKELRKMGKELQKMGQDQEG